MLRIIPNSMLPPSIVKYIQTNGYSKVLRLADSNGYFVLTAVPYPCGQLSSCCEIVADCPSFLAAEAARRLLSVGEVCHATVHTP
jgi:hypothetical protein